MRQGHSGERLRRFIKSKNVAVAKFARNIGKHPNTLHNWMEAERLNEENIRLIAESYPDVSEYFPEFDLSDVVMVSEPAAEYTSIKQLESGYQKQVDYWRGRCDQLTTKYERVMEKYQELLEKQAGI